MESREKILGRIELFLIGETAVGCELKTPDFAINSIGDRIDGYWSGLSFFTSFFSDISDKCLDMASRMVG